MNGACPKKTCCSIWGVCLSSRKIFGEEHKEKVIAHTVLSQAEPGFAVISLFGAMSHKKYHKNPTNDTQGDDRIEKVKKHFYLSQSDIEWLEDYRQESRLPNLSAALSEVIFESKNRNPGSLQREIMKMLAAEISSQMVPTLERVATGVNRIDKTTTVNQLLLNSLSGYSDFKLLYEAKSPHLQRAEELWQLQKEELRQKAIDSRSKSKRCF